MKKQINNITIDQNLYNFIEALLIENDLDKTVFFKKLEDFLAKNIPVNQKLLEKRIDFEQQINAFFKKQTATPSPEEMSIFLKECGYIIEEQADFSIDNGLVDDELSRIAGAQLVVPISNSRFALNALNARWGSLFDALYGSDMIDESAGMEKSKSYNPQRGKAAIEFSFQFLNNAVPLVQGSYDQIKSFSIDQQQLRIHLIDGSVTALKEASQFVAYQENQDTIASILLKNNDLHIDLKIDHNHLIGKENSAGIYDVILESAITVIQDMEDSVAAVDAQDKLLVYRNLDGLIKGTLKSQFKKGNQIIDRVANHDQEYIGSDKKKYIISARALMLIRNVGHLMKTPAVQYQNHDIPEGMLDLIMTTLISLFDIKQKGAYLNSKHKNIYIVKPKMHGPEEVKFTVSLFEQAEKIFDLQENTIKIGIMDEEKRTSVNLKNCIFEARKRLIFINTGFLDRTGDEIHTCMFAGVSVAKSDMKSELWLKSYEKWNVKIGLACGLKNKAQIGKGMWAMPDEMKKMYQTKHEHILAGANCAWVPSPLGATIHALHYHQYKVQDIQNTLSEKLADVRREDLLQIPVVGNKGYSKDEIQNELENNCQGILGYVVRWIDQGIGCSKVPDINHVNLMEDRATLRISSQILANWYQHSLIDRESIIAALKKMARIVDEQNKDDQHYSNMSDDFDHSIAFQAACQLIFEGDQVINGYTEPPLHKKRMEKKAQGGSL